MSGLPELVSRCLAGFGQISTEACNDAEYIHQIRITHDGLLTERDDYTRREPVATELPATVAFERVFIDYINANKPFKGILKDTESKLNDIFNSCSKGSRTVNNATLDISLTKCKGYPVSIVYSGNYYAVEMLDSPHFA